MSANIFISYRRDDTSDYALRLGRKLADEFGKQHVFLDTDSIGAGAVWMDEIGANLANSDAVLVLIGPQWLDIPNEAGRRRLDDPEDVVCREVAVALERAKDGEAKLIPVLIDGASMPAPKDLPKPLASLTEYNAVSIQDTWMSRESDFLVAAVEKIFEPDTPEFVGNAVAQLRQRQKLRRLGLASTVALALFVLFAGWIGLIDRALFQIQRTGNLSTIALGDLRAEKSLHEDIAIITMDQATEQAFGRPFGDPNNRAFWRSKHGELITKLSEQAGGGPKVIAFDISFEGDEPAADQQFADAAELAAENNGSVLVGARHFSADRPPFPAAFGDHIGGFGNVGVEEHREVAYAIALATLKRKPGPNQNDKSDPFAVEDPTGSTSVLLGEHGGVIIPALSLKSYAAYRDSDPNFDPVVRFEPLDLGHQNHVHVDYVKPSENGIGIDDILRTEVFPCLEVTVFANPRKKSTPIREAGDAFAAMALDLSPLELIRERTQKYEDVLMLSGDKLSSLYRGKVILVGRADSTDELTVRWKTGLQKRFGVELHADALNALLQGRSIHNPPGRLNLALTIGLFVLGALVCLGLKGRPAYWYVLAWLALVSAYVAVSVFAYGESRLLLSLLDGVLAFALSFFVVGRVRKYLS